MYEKFSYKSPRLLYTLPSTYIMVFGGVILLMSVAFLVIYLPLTFIPVNIENYNFIHSLKVDFLAGAIMFFIISLILFIIGLIIRMKMKPETKIKYMIKKRLFYHRYGNPLHLKEGDYLPYIKCKEVETDLYQVLIYAGSTSVVDLQKMSQNISSAIQDEFENYAVSYMDTDVSFNYVIFYLEDVKSDNTIYVKSVEDLKGKSTTLIPIDKRRNIDLTTSGSMLVAGKTRSGKTTGIMSMLMSVLEHGRDDYGSRVIIIDPKNAELSMLPHVISLDENDEAREILQSMREYIVLIKERQKVLNTFVDTGKVVKWFDKEVNMHPCMLFIDEYVALRDIFPKKAIKGDEEYCLTEFDKLLKRIITTGASAGCYVIVSIAEASVEQGGLPSMLKNAMGTKILFKPTLNEAHLMWDNSKLECMNNVRVYKAGDCWFSSTDGVHDNITFVHFPAFDEEFEEFTELNKLLRNYYST